MPIPADQLDTILALQLATAHAGERGSDSTRLNWWATDMVSEFGGLALFDRLAPRTSAWAALEVAREAARRTDFSARSKQANPDQLRTLFSLGFELDEQLADRLGQHKRSGHPPELVLPELAPLLADWTRDKFTAFAAGQGPTPKTANEPAGRRLTSTTDDLVALARSLVHALLPFTDAYPCPHVRNV